MSSGLLQKLFMICRTWTGVGFFMKRSVSLLTVSRFCSIIVRTIGMARPGIRVCAERGAVLIVKSLNIPMEDQYHEDLDVIQEFLSGQQGVKFSKSQALKKLLHECAGRIRDGGSPWSEGRERDGHA